MVTGPQSLDRRRAADEPQCGFEGAMLMGNRTKCLPTSANVTAGRRREAAPLSPICVSLLRQSASSWSRIAVCLLGNRPAFLRDLCGLGFPGPVSRHHGPAQGASDMTKSKSLPDYVVRLRTYGQLEEYAQAFADGFLNLLVTLGEPGLGKSRCLRKVVGERACWIDGTASPFGIYMEAYIHRDESIVLDDVDGLYGNKNGVRLLKSMCQTELLKTICWHTDAATLDRRGIPRQFTTASRVAIIANQWKTLNADVAALEDRGHVISFEPSAVEVHRQAATWFWDQEVFDFVAAHLHLMDRPSLRSYVLAYELKTAKLDWKQSVLSRCLKGTALKVATLKADPCYHTEEERAQAFVTAGDGCRATYFNHAAKLRPTEDVPSILLVNTSPPPQVTSQPDILELLRQRFGKLGSG
jgi:hypothetical protein